CVVVIFSGITQGSRTLALSCNSPLKAHPSSFNVHTIRNYSSSAKESEQLTEEAESKDGIHSIIKNEETVKGDSEKREFQAETRMLLDIVAKSLYSESEIFVRELVSNASDALEKFRYLSKTGENLIGADRPLEIHLATDKQSRTFTIQDTGVGMTREEMIENLGTIAKSGTKVFLEKVRESKSADPNSMIGQFGVGFYSSFMVANRVDVYSKSSKENTHGYKWSSDGSGVYEIQEAEGVQNGTKIVLHLKTDHRQFSDEETVLSIIKKYSNFVGNPIFLNGKQINTVQALWLMDPKTVTPDMHDEFYNFIGGSYDRPRFTLHFSTDVPLSLRCVLYVPDGKPGLFEMSKDAQIGVGLYSRKVMIKNKADNIIPNWLRFLKGVVDSEDIPLNLSRELLQDSALIRKLRTVVVNRVIRFLHDRSQKEAESFMKFYNDYGIFVKEGIITEAEQVIKEDIAKLLRFESSAMAPGELVSLPEYISRMQAAQKDVYYLAAPSRSLAERSPYLEALKEKNVEVLYCFQPYDEMVLIQLRQFDRKSLTSVEKEMRQMKENVDMDALPLGGLAKSEAEGLLTWLQQSLKGRAHSVKFTQKLENHPCVVTVEEMAAARHFIRTQSAQMTPEVRYSLLQPQFEVSIKHPLIMKLSTLKDSDPDLAKLLAEQLFANAMVTAGLEEDPRTIISSLTELLTKALEKV
ncbi:Heat shock protein 75 kDa, mitochondrial, partial [Orchesella cincta]